MAITNYYKQAAQDQAAINAARKDAAKDREYFSDEAVALREYSKDQQRQALKNSKLISPYLRKIPSNPQAFADAMNALHPSSGEWIVDDTNGWTDGLTLRKKGADGKAEGAAWTVATPSEAIYQLDQLATSPEGLRATARAQAGKRYESQLKRAEQREKSQLKQIEESIKGEWDYRKGLDVARTNANAAASRAEQDFYNKVTADDVFKKSFENVVRYAGYEQDPDTKKWMKGDMPLSQDPNARKYYDAAQNASNDFLSDPRRFSGSLNLAQAGYIQQMMNDIVAEQEQANAEANKPNALGQFAGGLWNLTGKGSSNNNPDLYTPFGEDTGLVNTPR